MDGCGRTASGTAVERPLKRILRSRHLHILVQHNAGAVAEPLPAMAEEPDFSGSCPITQVEVSMRVRRSQIDAAIRAMPAAAPIQMPGVASRP